MVDVANQDEAKKCLEIATSALQIGNLDKATRFAEKAMKLYPNDEARKILRLIRSKQGSTSTPQASQSNTPNGVHNTAPNSEMRNRASSSQAKEHKPDRSTPEQRQLVNSILVKKDFYAVLGVEKESTDDDIKRAYKKLALKLHPDKNTAPRSDEAFKVVSKAFSCLSDSQKRAAYDRYGEEQPGVGLRNNPFGGQGDDFDPTEIFNMFFGGGFPARNAHVFNFGGGFPPRHYQQRGNQGEHQNTVPAQIFAFLPILLMLIFSFFAMRPSEPIFSLDRTVDFNQQIKSSRFDVPFFVKADSNFERTYPRGSRERANIEREAELGFRERLYERCSRERVNRDRLFRWGQSSQAKEMKMPACEEIASRFGNQYAYQSPIFGY